MLKRGEKVSRAHEGKSELRESGISDSVFGNLVDRRTMQMVLLVFFFSYQFVYF